MGNWKIGSAWGVFVLALGMAGCGTSTKDRCKAMCEFDNRCGSEPQDCSDAALNSCVDSYNKLPGDCQDAIDDLADCVDNNEKCSDAQKECVDEATKVVDKCAA